MFSWRHFSISKPNFAFILSVFLARFVVILSTFSQRFYSKKSEFCLFVFYSSVHMWIYYQKKKKRKKHVCVCCNNGRKLQCLLLVCLFFYSLILGTYQDAPIYEFSKSVVSSRCHKTIRYYPIWIEILSIVKKCFKKHSWISQQVKGLFYLFLLSMYAHP